MATIPTPIVDKNGKRTTVHVKADSESAINDRVKGVSTPKSSHSPDRAEPLTKLRLGSFAYTTGHYLISLDQFDLNAPYQRGSVWGEEKKVNLIKSYIMGIPTGSVIINQRPYVQGQPVYAVIDGKQRIEATLDFFNDKVAVPTEWFSEEDANGHTGDTIVYSQLAKSWQRGFKMMTNLPAMEANVKTIEEEAEIFLLINTGGVEQTEDTIEKARNLTTSN